MVTTYVRGVIYFCDWNNTQLLVLTIITSDKNFMSHLTYLINAIRIRNSIIIVLLHRLSIHYILILYKLINIDCYKIQLDQEHTAWFGM